MSTPLHEDLRARDRVMALYKAQREAFADYAYACYPSDPLGPGCLRVPGQPPIDAWQSPLFSVGDFDRSRLLWIVPEAPTANMVVALSLHDEHETLIAYDGIELIKFSEGDIAARRRRLRVRAWANPYPHAVYASFNITASVPSRFFVALTRGLGDTTPPLDADRVQLHVTTHNRQQEAAFIRRKLKEFFK